MISFHINKKKTITTDLVKPINQSVFKGFSNQKSIKNYWQPISKINVSSKETHQPSNKCNQNQPNNQINDENCSYNANLFMQNENALNKEKTSKLQNQLFISKRIKEAIQPSSQSTTKQQLDQKKRFEELSKVVNLKKKIKKCTASQIHSHRDHFREKVSFIRKRYFLADDEAQPFNQTIANHITQQTPQQSLLQTYPVYKDSQVFPTERSRKFLSTIVTQRMDNDNETDDQHIEKFVNRIQSELLGHFEKVQKQKKEEKRKQQEQNKEEERNSGKNGVEFSGIEMMDDGVL